MEKYVTWIPICDAIEKLIKFLQDVHSDAISTTSSVTHDILSTYHVIFGCGTVVRVILTDEEFKGYDGSFMEEWPIERIENAETSIIDEIFSDCIIEWKIQSQILEEIDVNASKAIRCAYETFIKDGFPRLGECSARVCVPMECSENTSKDTNENISKSTNTLWGVMWKKRTYKIYNLVLGSIEDIQQMTSTGGELRRLDYMFPSVYAVISPQLKVYFLRPDDTM